VLEETGVVLGEMLRRALTERLARGAGITDGSKEQVRDAGGAGGAFGRDTDTTTNTDADAGGRIGRDRGGDQR
jgi:hypothetical protein